MSASDDQSDVEKVLAGEAAAFEGIVRRWQGPLVNLAYRFTRDRARAEELAQEAFLRAYRSLRGWRREAAFSTWLFTLATNLYRSELRRVPAIMVPLDQIAELREARTPDGNLRDAAGTAQQATMFMQEFDEVPTAGRSRKDVTAQP